MLDKIIHFSIKNKFIVSLFTIVLVVVGIFSFYRLPIDAIPDITNNQVQIITSSPNLATQEVEQFITYPVELAVKSIPKIIELRSTSRFGLSVVTIVFEEDVDLYWARAQINEKLKETENSIPKEFGTPELAPISTGLGEIYQYVVQPKKGYEKQFNPMELRSLQDWLIRPQLIGVKGVAEVNTLGGHLKEYQIQINPNKLKSMDITIPEIFDALNKNNENTGGAYIDKKPYAYFVRGIGMVSSMDDIKKIVIKTKNDIPILIQDVAEVQLGSSTRYGAVTVNGNGEEVIGTVMMLKGENSSEVIDNVKNKMEQVRKSLPKGVDIKVFSDRSELIGRAINTVEKNLLEGALIVVFVLVLLLGNWRAGLIVASVIPLSLLFAISMMKLFGVSGNLMSLGAIDFGLIVDGAVIIVEAIIHQLHSRKKAMLSREQMDIEVYQAASKIRSSAAFGEIIILIVYLPILALVGIEGKMFSPMAQTVSFAILGAFILSLTYVPMMTALVLKKETGHKENLSDKIIAFFYKVYQPLLEKALKIKSAVLIFSFTLFVMALMLFGNLGGEFIPTLDEGDIATHVIIASGSSLSQEVETTTKAEKLLKERFPEVKMIVTKIGSAEIPTDPMPMEAGDMIILLKDPSEWTSAKTKKELIEKMEATLAEIPGLTTEFSQPIQMRFNELMTGVRSDVAVKIYGEDLETLVGKGDEVVSKISDVPGIVGLKAERITGLPQITVRYNKDKLALYGLNVGDLNRIVRTGFAGEKTGFVYEGEKRFDIVLRINENNRNDITDLKSLYITLPSGNQIPLGQVADIQYEPGPIQISREEGKRRIVIGFNVRNRDVKSVVNDVQKIIDNEVDLPAGYYTTYGGQFENLVNASNRLAVAVPIALALIFILLYFTFHSVKQALLIFTAIPLSAIGGVFALWMRDMPFSISAGVGFIALFGVAVLNGIVLVSCFNQLKSNGMSDIIERVKEGTKIRLRPVLMTASVASLGFLPMALSTSAGAEVQKPLATVVIGGLISATLLTLIVLPILYILFERISPKFNAKTVISCLILSIGMNFSSIAQNNHFTLDEALKLAYENNQLMKSGQLEILSNQQLKSSAFDLPMTSVKGMFGQYNSKAFDQNYAIEQSFNVFKFKPQADLIKANVKLSEFNLENQQNELRLQIRQSWNNLLYFKEKEKNLFAQDSIINQFVKASELKYGAGEINGIEKNTPLLKQLEIKQLLEQNARSIIAEKSNLKILLGIQNDFEINEEFVRLFVVTSSDSNQFDTNPLLKISKQQIELAQSNQKMEQSNLYPDISAGYFIQSLTGNQEINGNTVAFDGSPRFQGFTLGLSIPLFSNASIARSKSATTKALAEQERMAYVKNQLIENLNNEIVQIKSLEQTLNHYTEVILPLSLKVEEQLKKSLNEGEISHFEFLQAVQSTFESKLNLINVIHQINQSVNNINYLLNQ